VSGWVFVEAGAAAGIPALRAASTVAACAGATIAITRVAIMAIAALAERIGRTLKRAFGLADAWIGDAAAKARNFMRWFGRNTLASSNPQCFHTAIC
jgi:hypothetical protein